MMDTTGIIHSARRLRWILIAARNRNYLYAAVRKWYGVGQGNDKEAE